MRRVLGSFWTGAVGLAVTALAIGVPTQSCLAALGADERLAAGAALGATLVAVRLVFR